MTRAKPSPARRRRRRGESGWSAKREIRWQIHREGTCRWSTRVPKGAEMIEVDGNVVIGVRAPGRLADRLYAEMALITRRAEMLERDVRAAERRAEAAELEAESKSDETKQMAEDMTYLGEPIAHLADKAAIHSHDIRAICAAVKEAGFEFDGKTNVVRLIGQLIGQRDELRRLLAERERRAETGAGG